MSRFLFLSLLLLINGNRIVLAQSWTELGPIHFPVISGSLNGTGRVNQICFHSSQANKMYALTRYGGLYISNDTGANWSTLGTDILSSCYLSSFSVDPVNDQIIYLSTCDPLFYQTNCIVYKTVDGGVSWDSVNTGLVNSLASQILIDPANTQNVILATNNGIWQTINGGINWVLVKSGGDFRHMMQIPTTNILLAVTKDEVWRSIDFGTTWVQITSAVFSQPGSDGMRVCVNTTSSNVVYVISNGGNGVVYKSLDSGITFTKIYSSTSVCLVCTDSDPLNHGQGDYDFAACSDPSDPNHLYVAAHCIWESVDGGLSWQQKTQYYSPVHTDHTQLLFDPFDNSKLWISNDGGVWQRVGTDDSTWVMKSNGLTSLEIWKGACSPKNKNLISIGTQDNGELYGDSLGWYNISGGDFNVRVSFDYTNSNNLYYLTAGTRRSFSPLGTFTSFQCPFVPDHYNYTRIAFNKNNTDLAVLGRDSLWLSTNISSPAPVWSLVNPSASSIKDVVISTADNTIAYQLCVNKLYRINNLTSVPVVTSFALPSSFFYEGSVATVKNNVNIVYMTCGEKVYRSPDQGATWTNITYNLPQNDIIKIFIDDYSTDESVYLCSGTAYSKTRIFKKTINDTAWQDISGNLPKVANISDFFMYNDSTNDSKLLVTTMGRGVWEYKFHNPIISVVGNYEKHGLSFKVYPNPASTEIYFENSESRKFAIRLYSDEGRLIKEESSETSIFRWNCSSLITGTYYYQIYCEKGKVSGRVEIVK